MEVFQKPPVFILSPLRSGSTFLFRKLREQQEFFCLNADSRIIDLLYQERNTWSKEGKEPFVKKVVEHYRARYKNRIPRIDLDSLEEDLKQEEDPLRGAVTTIAYYEGLAANKPMTRDSIPLEKSPVHLHYRSFLERLFPEARFILLYRDPRAVVASLNGQYWSGHNLVSNAKHWREGVHKMECFKPAIRVRYEDLVKNPEWEVGRIRDFLGLMDNEKEGEDAKEFRADKWKEKLSQIDRERDIIEALCGKKMKDLGYRCDGVNKDLKYYRTYFHYWLDDGIGRLSKLLKRKYS